MRQVMAKSVRRDMRRAMGDGALVTIKEQDTAIGMIANGLATVQREIASLAISHATFRQETGTELSQIHRSKVEDYQHFEAVCAPLCNSTLWTRLRWLLTGK